MPKQSITLDTFIGPSDSKHCTHGQLQLIGKYVDSLQDLTGEQILAVQALMQVQFTLAYRAALDENGCWEKVGMHWQLR